MTASMQKLIGTAVLGLALFSNSIPAWAGASSRREVLIQGFAADSKASGTTAGARYSNDSQQYIGCSLFENGGPTVLCAAKDKTGKALVCTASGSKWVAVAKSITDFSQIIFFAAQASYASCSRLEVGNDSLYLK